jgi:hypothetical protein
VVLVPEVVIAMWRRGYPVVWLFVDGGCILPYLVHFGVV